MKRLAWVGLVMGLLATAGCRNANSEKSYDIKPENLTSADMPAAKSIVIEFESKDNVPVTATLVKAADAGTALKALEGGKSIEESVASVKAIASQTGAKGTLTTPTTDSKELYSVLFYTKKATTVTVRSKGK
jgi:hypothetical protein